jgi:hypothetical protein
LNRDMIGKSILKMAQINRKRTRMDCRVNPSKEPDQIEPNDKNAYWIEEFIKQYPYIKPRTRIKPDALEK